MPPDLLLVERKSALQVDRKSVNYTQYVSGERTEQRMRTLTEYEDVRSGLSDKDFAEEISSGMIFNRVTTISMT